MAGNPDERVVERRSKRIAKSVEDEEEIGPSSHGSEERSELEEPQRPTSKVLNQRQSILPNNYEVEKAEEIDQEDLDEDLEQLCPGVDPVATTALEVALFSQVEAIRVAHNNLLRGVREWKEETGRKGRQDQKQIQKLQVRYAKLMEKYDDLLESGPTREATPTVLPGAVSGTYTPLVARPTTNPTRQETPYSVAESIASVSHHKTIKLKELSVFKNNKGDLKVEDWILDARTQIDGRPHLFPTEAMKVAYLTPYVQGEAREHIRPYMEGPNQFFLYTQFLDVLKKVYGRTAYAKKSEARANFRSLYQGEQEFSAFWGTFLKLLAELGEDAESHMDDLIEKTRSDLQLKLIGQKFNSIYEMADHLMEIEPRLKALEQKVIREERIKQRRADQVKRTGQNKKVDFQIPGKSSTPVPFPQPGWENKLTNEKREKFCFKCKKPGHLTKDHVDDRVNAIDDDDDESLVSLSEEEGKEQL